MVWAIAPRSPACTNRLAASAFWVTHRAGNNNRVDGMRMRPVGILLLAAIVALAAYFALTANDVPKAAERARSGWARVEQEFRKRAEFVPEIVGAVALVNSGQQALIDKVKTAQAGVLALKPDDSIPASPARLRSFMKVQDGLSESLGEVMDLMRLYPDRSREENIRKVFAGLEMHENFIVVARNVYVEQARSHNELRGLMPQRLIAALFPPQPPALVPTFDPDKM